MANYRVNIKNKTVILDMDNITDKEMDIVKTYAAAGYLLKEKRIGITYADMRKGLKNNTEALNELNNKIKAKENYMIIKKWYKQQINKIKK